MSNETVVAVEIDPDGHRQLWVNGALYVGPWLLNIKRDQKKTEIRLNNQLIRDARVLVDGVAQASSVELRLS